MSFTSVSSLNVVLIIHMTFLNCNQAHSPNPKLCEESFENFLCAFVMMERDHFTFSCFNFSFQEKPGSERQNYWEVHYVQLGNLNDLN